MYLTQAVHKGARERPQALVAFCGEEHMSRMVFAGRVAAAAAALQALGVRDGDRVALLGVNSLRLLEAFYAIWWAGGVVNPVNVRWTPEEVAYSLDDCEAGVLVVDDACVAIVPALRTRSRSLRTVIHCGDAPPPDLPSWQALIEKTPPTADAMRGGDDLAAILYTGGTTGRPKGVMLSHTQLALSALSNSATVDRSQVRVGLVAAPMFHVGGLSLSLILMQRLVPQVLLPAFDEVAVMAAVQVHQVNEVFLVPAMLQRLVDHPRFGEFDMSSLRLVLYGAAPMETPLLRRAMAALPHSSFAQAYGMTELAPTITMLSPEDHRLEGAAPAHLQRLRSAGRPVPIAEVRVVDSEGRDCPTGQPGEIVARGPMVMQGYWAQPAATAEALRDGWMHTGDIGHLDADGYLYVVDRLKDMIVTGGENVYSAEVENALAALPGVAMSAVIGVPDDRWGERVHAVIMVRPGFSVSEADVIAHCKSRLAGYKCPRSVEFREQLPLSAAGKLQKFQLRAPHWAGCSRQVHG